MKLTVLETRREYVEVDVDLPLYRQHSLGEYPITDIYMRVDEHRGKLREIKVKVTKDATTVETELTVTYPYQFDGSSADYMLGRGEYRCTPEDFGDALKLLRAMLDEA